MIKYYTSERRQLRELDSREPGCWINISPPFTQEELSEVAAEFDIPLDFITDSLDLDERSRYETEDDVRLIVVNTPVENFMEEEIDAYFLTVPIGIILVNGYLLTITAYDNPVLDKFLAQRVKNPDISDHKYFVLQILEQNVLRFLSCLKQLNMKRNLIERELYDSSRNRELRQLLSIEKSLVYFLNSLSANELLKMKMKRSDYLGIRGDEVLTDLFEDIIIDNTQASEMAKVYTEILNGTMDAYTSIISNNLNVVIQRLTLITIILTVPTLVASLYGMNVDLPFSDSPFAFWMVLIVSSVLSGLLVWYFQRKRLF